MHRETVRRGLAMMLSAVVFLALPFMFTTEANAASGSKTIYVVTQMNSTYESSNGSVEKSVIKYTYNKNGLLKQQTSKGITDAYKIVYSRNKAGAVTGTKSYNSEGKLQGVTSNTIKNGNIVKSKSYNVDPATGKKTLFSTTTRTYKKGKLTKEVTKGASGYTDTATYYSNGVIKKSVFKSADSEYVYNYNKKGLPTTATSKSTYAGYTQTSTSTYDITTNKKGYITKEVVTTKVTANGTTTTEVNTAKNKYTFKSGRLVKQVSTHTYKSGDYSYSSKDTTTYKYKAVKVLKKYLKYAG